MAKEVSFAVRMDAQLLALVRSVARGRDETVSQVVRRLLRVYVASAPVQFELEAAIAASKSAPVSRQKALVLEGASTATASTRAKRQKGPRA
jgi:hypothetical protein